MAPTDILFISVFICSIHLPDAQVLTGSSSFSPVEVLNKSSPLPTKQTTQSWPSFSERGRTDVPFKVVLRDTMTTAAQQGQRMTHPTAQSTPSFLSVLSTHNLNSGPVRTWPTLARSRTDTASLAVSRASGARDTTIKASTSLLPTLSSTAGADSAGEKLVTNRQEEAPVKETEEANQQEWGSGSVPTAVLSKDQSPVPLPTVGHEMAQYQPQAQNAISEGSASKTSSMKTSTGDSQSTKPAWSPATPQTETRLTLLPLVTQATAHTVALTGELSADPSSTSGVTSKQDDPAEASTPPTATTPGSTNKQLHVLGSPVTAPIQTSSHLNSTAQQVTTASTSPVLTTTQEAGKSVSKTTNQTKRTTTAGVTVQSTQTGILSVPTTTVLPVAQTRLGPTLQTAVAQQNRSVLLGHAPQPPHFPSAHPAPAPSVSPSHNVTLLYWVDLSQTLAFAWELHVYGSASLFLLLFAGAAVGLTLSPSTNCPHQGALALANALLILAGGIRAALFLVDPYGTRHFLPRPAVTALYNLPLHLLVWTQAALVLLAMRAVGVSVLPSALECPPLVAVLAVLQCTLLLATDLLSPAFSPVVPVTLQILSLCWGIALCLGFLCYVFPRLRCPTIPHHEVPEEARRKALTGSRRTGVILARVLAVCAVLGALCCGLHVHATLWLYGLLGDWTRFNWGWWLVHFWARLLELAWGFSLLLQGSWLFWKPQGCQGRERTEIGAGRAGGDLPSPGQSVSSTNRHTCWSKIVQSLRGKPCRKSESNGVGGGGGSGEVPNNSTSQERPGADITKSLIRNQNHKQVTAGQRSAKDSNRGWNHRGHFTERGISNDSTGSLLRLQALSRPPPRSVSGNLVQDRDTSVSLYEFDLRPPSPIDLTRSIDEALHREHLLGGGSLFQPLTQTSQSPSPGSGISQGLWLRRNSDPQLSESSDAQTESSMPLGGSVLSSVPSRQVTAPPTPSHQGHRWAGKAVGSVPSSVSCPVSLRPSRTSAGHLGDDGVDDTRPFITPDSEMVRGRSGRPVGSRSYLEVSRHDDSASVNSEIIDL
ncbi:proline-rich transmembrane protein 3 [Thalassophryne amazonica]|uniref:proline-rich transmembrane protein 3 n=1 Tax=Thalassophryne amazonica TaxID=390379 RepID=UPI0014716268|nr:proline-rich transmembrane protein 3 [Thalassophryne amazonica]XP_034028607.1 proline-rich transmembrane protein 3 [Thalassophryne amazonica]